jgi:mxaJ protein
MSLVSELLAASALCAFSAVATAAPLLRVCSDPSNMPYSNDQQQGFENRLASLIASDLHMELSYFWFPQREAFFRKTLNSGMCDVVMGVPAGFDDADTTRPYYRSTYVFITRRDRNLHISSLDDPRLKALKVGVHILGEQDDSLPPVHALISRGIVRNLVGYSIFGNLNEKDPPADLLRAVADDKVDVAVAWGPLAGYFAQHSSVPLEMTPIAGDPMHPELPFHFDIGIGVRHGSSALKETLNSELDKLQPQIDQLLRSYGVPQLTLPHDAPRAESAAKEER